jgi:hypothetical protein
MDEDDDYSYLYPKISTYFHFFESTDNIHELRDKLILSIEAEDDYDFWHRHDNNEDTRARLFEKIADGRLDQLILDTINTVDTSDPTSHSDEFYIWFTSVPVVDEIEALIDNSESYSDDQLIYMIYDSLFEKLSNGLYDEVPFKILANPLSEQEIMVLIRRYLRSNSPAWRTAYRG